MSKFTTKLTMPRARAFGWSLRAVETSHFAIHQRANGQFCVVLNHALLRGVRAEMIHWWFLNFPNMRVRLDGTPGYDGATAPGYLLWHPSDHHSATLSGRVAPDGSSRAGAKIHIREAMQYETYGWKYPVDNALDVTYVGSDGWAMGRMLPLFGPVMMLRIHFRDVVEDGEIIGVHYHYEIVIGLSATNVVARQINRSVTQSFNPEFFEAWHLHNVIEVGVFENFLPALFAQRAALDGLRYAPEMNPATPAPSGVRGWSRALFDDRLAAYQSATDPFAVQAFDQPSFL